MRRSIVLSAAGLVLALVAAGCVGFTVTKNVTGGGEPSGPFQVRIECQSPTPPDPAPLPQVQTFDFSGPASSYPQTLASEDFFLDANGDLTCLVTEPVTANATLPPTIVCQTEPPPTGVTCTPTPEGLRIDVDQDPTFDGRIGLPLQVRNDIPAPPTTVDPNAGAEAIELTPSFTA